MVWPDNEYDTEGSFTRSGDSYSFTHKAYGADYYRWSADFGKSWGSWTAWEDTSNLNASRFTDPDIFWDGHHIVVQCTFSHLLK